MWGWGRAGVNTRWLNSLERAAGRVLVTYDGELILGGCASVVAGGRSKGVVRGGKRSGSGAAR